MLTRVILSFPKASGQEEHDMQLIISVWLEEDGTFLPMIPSVPLMGGVYADWKPPFTSLPWWG